MWYLFVGAVLYTVVINCVVAMLFRPFGALMIKKNVNFGPGARLGQKGPANQKQGQKGPANQKQGQTGQKFGHCVRKGQPIRNRARRVQPIRNWVKNVQRPFSTRKQSNWTTCCQPIRFWAKKYVMTLSSNWPKMTRVYIGANQIGPVSRTNQDARFLKLIPLCN